MQPEPAESRSQPSEFLAIGHRVGVSRLLIQCSYSSVRVVQWYITHDCTSSIVAPVQLAFPVPVSSWASWSPLSGRYFQIWSTLQSSARPILENYGCRWNESWIKVLYEAGGPPDVTELLLRLSSKLFYCDIGPSKALLSTLVNVSVLFRYF
jgi:hypothetical protein